MHPTVDLGAGFGMHTIPLARRGCSVLAVDTSAVLLEELRGRAEALPVELAEDDLLSFQRHVASSVDIILCMGDTLTHLPDRSSVEKLFSLAAQSLRPDGKFIATFRDYTTAPDQYYAPRKMRTSTIAASISSRAPRSQLMA